jgi:hypothetical protein
MTNSGFAGAVVGAEFASSDQAPATAGTVRRAMRALWGAVCGCAFLVTRASIYVIALPVTAFACLTGIALYGLHAVARGHRG